MARVHAPVRPLRNATKSGSSVGSQNVKATFPDPPPAAFTVPVTLVVTLANPVAAPVMVAVNGPVAAPLVAVKVTVDEVPVADAGLNVADTPEGSGPIVSATAPVKPPVRVIVTVLVPVAPCVTATAVALRA